MSVPRTYVSLTESAGSVGCGGMITGALVNEEEELEDEDDAAWNEEEWRAPFKSAATKRFEMIGLPMMGPLFSA